jgi:hypothetical protein
MNELLLYERVACMRSSCQNHLHSAEAELDRLKQYLNEVLEEVTGSEV